jgi:hypothetical protein
MKIKTVPVPSKVPNNGRSKTKRLASPEIDPEQIIPMNADGFKIF